MHLFILRLLYSRSYGLAAQLYTVHSSLTPLLPLYIIHVYARYTFLSAQAGRTAVRVCNSASALQWASFGVCGTWCRHGWGQTRQKPEGSLDFGCEDGHFHCAPIFWQFWFVLRFSLENAIYLSKTQSHQHLHTHYIHFVDLRRINIFRFWRVCCSRLLIMGAFFPFIFLVEPCICRIYSSKHKTKTKTAGQKSHSPVGLIHFNFSSNYVPARWTVAAQMDFFHVVTRLDSFKLKFSVQDWSKFVLVQIAEMSTDGLNNQQYVCKLMMMFLSWWKLGRFLLVL